MKTLSSRTDPATAGRLTQAFPDAARPASSSGTHASAQAGPAPLPPGSPKRTLRLAYALLDDITRGGMPPGSRLPSVKVLSGQFRASMPSVREALVALETLGYVDLVHGVGTVVRKHSVAVQPRDDDMIALLEARRLLEGTAAAQAARQAPPDGLPSLTLAMRALSAAPLADAGNRLRAFHLCLAGLTGNGAIIMTVDQLWPSEPSGAHLDSLWGQALCQNLAAWIASHQRICDAVVNRSARDAQSAMNDFSDQATTDVFRALEIRDVARAAQAIAGKQRQWAQRRLRQ